MLKRFVSISFIVACLVYLAQGQVGATATWRVQRYDLNVTLPDNSRSVPVQALLTLTNVSSSPAGTLTLRISQSADVSSVKVNDSAVDFTKSEEKAGGSISLQRIGMRIPSVAPGGSITTAVAYKLNLKDNNALASLSLAGAQFLPLSFWYPTPNSWYFARGADAAPFRLSVAAPGRTLVSSGGEAGGAFEEKLNAQPFFVAASWDRIDATGVAVYVPKGTSVEGQKRATELAALFSDARAFCESILGKAPDVPLRIASSRRGAGFSGAGTVIVDDAVFRRSKVDSLTAMNVAEAAAKLWIGGSAAVTGDGHGVLTEGLPRFIATQFIETKYGKDVADIERLRQRVSYAAVSKRDTPLTTAAPIDDYYFPEVANKGAMVWRVLAKRVGQAEFGNTLKASLQDGKMDLSELRAGFSTQKELLDYMFDRVTDMDLQVGLPIVTGSDAKIATRNTGAADVTVDITATTATGERITSPTTIRATSYGEVVFRSPAKIVRVEIDSDKLYPQTEYANDIAPKEIDENDPLVATKKAFDKQDFAGAETIARKLLQDLPRFDDMRILLARSLLSEKKDAEAEREFRAVLDEKLPTARSLAWANVGLGEIALRSGKSDAALKFAEAAILSDAEYGASLAARNLRNRISSGASVEPAAKSFFADFDRAAAANKKSDIEALTMPGEVARFAAGVAGSTQQWQTQVVRVDMLDANTALVEANMTVKLLNKDVETGMAVYRLARTANGWRLAAVEMFEVR